MSQSTPEEFCNTYGSQQNRGTEIVGQFLSHKELKGFLAEHNTRMLHKAPQFSVYTSMYLKVIEGRDAARCDPSSTFYGGMHGSNLLDRLIGDAIADMMARSLVHLTETCAKKDISPVDLGSRWCDFLNEAENSKFDSLRTAMGMFTLYLSENMGHAISAIPFLDQIWIGSDFQTFEKRVKRLREYKTLYNGNNAFIASQFPSALAALVTSCSAKPSAIAAKAARVPLFQPFVKLLRDQVFAAGIELAVEYQDRSVDHPLLEYPGKFSSSVRVIRINLDRAPRPSVGATKLLSVVDRTLALTTCFSCRWLGGLTPQELEESMR